jgi:hypothetical protein
LDVGLDRALLFQEAALRDLLAEHAGGEVRLVVMAADGDFVASRYGGPNVEVGSQQGPDLGARLWSAVHAVPGPVVVIGSDLPTVTKADVRLALRLLKRYELVLGPAHDGGYWLIGLRAPGDVFSGVPWSTSGVLDATCRRARTLGWKVAFLDTRSDVDTGADLEFLLQAPNLPHHVSALKNPGG